MQIEIMRHHGRADNAERQIKHLAVMQNRGGRRESPEHGAPVRIGQRDLDRKAGGDHAEHRDHESLDPAEAERLQRQDQEHIRGGDDHADLERNMKQQVEPDRGADHLGQISRGDRDLRRQPQRPRDPARKRIAAGLRKVTAGADTKPRTKRLQHDRHQIREHRDRQQRVTELRSRPASEVAQLPGSM